MHRGTRSECCVYPYYERSTANRRQLSSQEVDLAGPGFSHPRKVVIDPVKPINIRTFVQGTMIECFINDQYAFSCRGYNSRKGGISLNVEGGEVKVTDLKIKIDK
ncbi:MAG: GH32 C-terminal domain-containing protein [Armatimonadota bacterium]